MQAVQGAGPHDTVAEDEVAVELDGPDIHPQNIRSVEFLSFASAFFELLEHLIRVESGDSEPSITFNGVRVLDKCAALAIKTNNPVHAKAFGERALRLVEGLEDPPETCIVLIDRVRERRRATALHATVRVGSQWEMDLQAPKALSEMRHWPETTTMRVTPVRIGGKDTPTVGLEAEGEPRSFTLSVIRPVAVELARHLYKQVDAEVRVHRDMTGRIRTGQLLNFREVTSGDSLQSWRDWYRTYLSDWDDVEDIEAELGRD